MNYLRIAINIFSSGMDAIAIYTILNTFLGKVKVSGRMTILIYSVWFLCSSISVLLIENPLILLGIALFLCFAVSFIYTGGIFIKLFASIITTILAVLAEILAGISLAVLTAKSVEILSTSTVYYIEAVVVSKAVLLIFVKAIQYKKLPSGTKVPKKFFVPLMALPLSTLFIIFVMSEYAYSQSEKKSVTTVGIAAIMLIMANILVYYLFDKLLIQEVDKQRSVLNQQQLKYQTQYYKELAEKYKLSNKTVHDTKNQLFAVSIAIGRNEIEKAKSKIDELCNNVFGVSAFIKTGNDALDALLNSKYRNIEESKINFVYNVFINADNQVDDIDLCIIVGNALDNAVEACSAIDTGSKKDVVLKMLQANDYLTIEVSNPISTVNKIVHGKIKTSKKDTVLHGFGLQSIEEIVNKYDGNLIITQNDGVFVLKIYMKNRI